jgi:hypothetical protein
LEKTSYKKQYFLIHKIKQFNDNLELFLTIPQIKEIAIVFTLSALITSVLIFVGSQYEITGFALLTATLIFIVWCKITIYFEHKREKINN